MALPMDEDLRQAIRMRAERGRAPDPRLREAVAGHEEERLLRHQAAAYHLRAAQQQAARGDRQARDKHMLMLGIHCDALGINKARASVELMPYLGAPQAVQRGYHGHAGDRYLLEKP